MTELFVLILFCFILLICLFLGISVLTALLAGLIIFLLYGFCKGFSPRALFFMCLDGVRTVRNILLTFLMIGMLTAVWRAAGTIPVIVYYASLLIRPSIFVLMAFLLCCGISVLTGSSFATAATMGVICASIGRSLGIDMRITGGAVLAGAFFGDRCSPVSTSALLVAELTGTDIFSNIRKMLRTALIPFVVSCALYACAGLLTGHADDTPDLYPLFSRGFNMHWIAVIPAVVILCLSLMRVRVRKAMGISILIAAALCLFLQKMPLPQLLYALLAGFHTTDEQLGAMMNGGGILSMLRSLCIVCISSAYAGIFAATGLLDGITAKLAVLSQKTTVFATVFLTALLSSVVACNQTLATILTHQLCRGLYSPDSGSSADNQAIDLEDTSIVIPPLIPWSIAGAVPLASIGAPAASVLFAWFLYLLPLWRTGVSILRRRHLRTPPENCRYQRSLGN